MIDTAITTMIKFTLKVIKGFSIILLVKKKRQNFKNEKLRWIKESRQSRHDENQERKKGRLIIIFFLSH